MTCADARERFVDLVDGELTAADRDAFDAHLAGCGDCRRDLDRYHKTVSLLHEIEPARAPVGFVDRVLAAARPEPWLRRLARRLLLPLPVKLPVEAAAIVLVAVGVIYVFQRTPELRQAAHVETPLTETRSRAGAPAAGQALESESRVGDRGAREPSFADRAAAPETVRGQPPRKETTAPGSLARPQVAGTSQDTGVSERSRAPELLSMPSEARGKRDARDAPADAQRVPPPAAAPPSAGAPVPEALGEQRPREAQQAPHEAPQAVREAPGTPEPKREEMASRLAASSALRRQAGDERSEAARAAAGAVAKAAPPSVAGRLTVRDRADGERAVADLATRHRAIVVSRREDADATVLDVVVPGETYRTLVAALREVGRWQPDHEPDELPAAIRLTIRLTR